MDEFMVTTSELGGLQRWIRASMWTHASLDLLWMGYLYLTSPLYQCLCNLTKYHPHPWEHHASPSMGDFLETGSHPSSEQEKLPNSIKFARLGMIRVSEDDYMEW